MYSALVDNGRRRILGWILRLQSRRSKPGTSLLERLPGSVLIPLQRVGVNPSPDLTGLRDREPVSRLKLPLGIRGWLISGYDESKAMLSDPKSFSNDFGHIVGAVGVTVNHNPGGLGMTDPPDHTRLRQMLTPEFTGRRLSRLTSRVDTIVEAQLDAMEAAADENGVVDLVEHFALPIPALTIYELLGVAKEDHADLQRLSTARFDVLGGTDGTFGAISESVDSLLQVVARQREHPGDGLLGRLITQYGADVSDRELAGVTDGLLTGGLETTAGMLALGSLVLLREDGAMDELRSSDEHVSAYVEELLRYLTVVQLAFPRFAKKDVTIGGRRIRAGDVVLSSLSAANRDPRIAEAEQSLDTFDPHRSVPSHLAFGYGIHRCIGAELARMELRAAYPRLARRFPDLRLAVPEETLAYRKLSFVYGVESLPVVLR
jgi:cytochrome P450